MTTRIFLFLLTTRAHKKASFNNKIREKERESRKREKIMVHANKLQQFRYKNNIIRKRENRGSKKYYI